LPPNEDVVKKLVPIPRKKRVYDSDGDEDEEAPAAKAGKKSTLSEAIIQDSDDDMADISDSKPAQPEKAEEDPELADLFGEDD
jgi:hypothetical protein